MKARAEEDPVAEDPVAEDRAAGRITRTTTGTKAAGKTAGEAGIN
jgi:hypothetical protein